MTDTRRRAALAPVLIFASMVVALISSLGAPLLPSISTHMHVALSAAQWSLTITLLVGTVSSPIMGRLGDGPHRREMIIAGLTTVTTGGVVAALASSLPVLVAGRGLQGIGLGLVPLAMAAARDHLPAERSRSTIAQLSVIVAAGIGVGYPVSGLIADTLGLSAAFWFGAAVSGLALLGVVAVVPSSKDRAAARLDVPGALLLTAGLAALLLAIADGQSWGWASPAILGLLAAAVIALTTWVFQQLHASAPLIQLRLLRHPNVLTGDVCAIVIGVVMYMNLSGISEYVQVPKTTGYGFSASVVVAGLCLVPSRWPASQPAAPCHGPAPASASAACSRPARSSWLRLTPSSASSTPRCGRPSSRWASSGPASARRSPPSRGSSCPQSPEPTRAALSAPPKSPAIWAIPSAAP